ncbi:MAG: hypothetical protein OXK17_09435 [Thaumarchaeota archaeon]|nr:hypothetical protein [Nitrososphaerota archaeon]
MPVLHFIFVTKHEQDRAASGRDYNYVQRMAAFYGSWIREKFGISYEIKCDELVANSRGVLDRINMHTLVRDHEHRGKNTYHFYLTYFRPIWTDCTCEGYHAENFGMAYWQSPKDADISKEEDADLFFAEKNCTVVSHQILHEMLRMKGNKRHIQDVHDLWTKHVFSQLEFVQYDGSHEVTEERPSFLVVDASALEESS